jgi:thiol-disulfide isomerase/thioredoxin
VKRLASISTLWDVLALLMIAFAIWKIFVAPRSFIAAGSQPAPHAVYDRLDGGAFRTADQHGHLLFLDFYATWCVPCRTELPLVEQWSKRHPGAVVVPVDVGEPRAVALAFARKHGLRNVALDPSGRAQALFGVEGFPTIVVIDAAGYIRARWQGLNPAIAVSMTNAQQTLAR